MGYQTFIDHPLVACFLAQAHADLGSSETRARHLFLVDRETRQVYVVRFNEGQRFLHAQWGPLPILTPEELMERVRLIQAQMEAWERQPPEDRHREVMQRITKQQEACERLQTWLTQQQTHQYN